MSDSKLVSSKLVSIIIDNYNHARFIGQAIDSCLEQTFPAEHLEIIVVDDGSTDNSRDIVKSYGDKVKLIEKSNGGQSSAFNVGFAEAQGKYCVLLDSDDYCLPERVERVVEEFEKYPDTILVYNGRHIIGPSLDYREPIAEFHDLELAEENLLDIRRANFGLSRTSVRKRALNNILPLPEHTRIGADIFMLSLYVFGNISSLPDILTTYRVHEDNLFHSDNLERRETQIAALRENLASIRQLLSERISERQFKLFEKALQPYELMQRDLEYSVLCAQDKATKRDLLSLEIDKLNLYSADLNFFTRLYKWLRLPILMLLPTSMLPKLRSGWARLMKVPG